MTHEKQICVPFGHGFYSYKNWSRDFRCPVCERIGRFNLNFLGQRDVVCDGDRFTKQEKAA